MSVSQACEGMVVDGAPPAFNVIYHKLDPQEYKENTQNRENNTCNFEWESRLSNDLQNHIIYYEGVCPNGTWKIKGLFIRRPSRFFVFRHSRYK